MSEESLFELALNTPESERAELLDRECAGDPELRARVEALLSADGRTLGFLPPTDGGTRTFGDAEGTRTAEPPVVQPGILIAGRYKLLQQIGEGGMGSVYLASQTEPVKRPVAVKLIKAGLDSKAVLARFDAERQALALMDHPNIARIYDGGVTPAGQPFFVMELVKGVPLTEYCDSRRLTVDARLQLFVQVCQAVQHAHQKGIIHRDLKPGNVLVTEVDGRPTPKVIDFGVAKATELKLTDLSLADTGAIVGTPAYMSPEQADPTSMDIDTRTDVYALGVMLYELLTGSPPIDGKQFKRGAVLEMLRMVREVEPPRPSTKLSTAVALPNIAANRGTEPGKLASSLRGELDWVVMKAMEKDRTRRYESANGFAADIQRYLADEVVEARPPSRGYRLRKFVRRNKAQVVAASLVLLALVGGVVGTGLGMIEAGRQAEKATAEAKRATDAANGEAAQKRIAEANAKDAEDKATHARLAEAAEKKAKEEALLAAAAETKAKDVAVALAKREAEAKEQTRRQLRRAEWSVYAGKLLQAQAAFDGNNVRDAFIRLEDCQWNLRGWEHAHLRRRFDSSRLTLKGHANPVTSVAFSPDGKRIVTGSYDGTARVWDAETGTEVLALRGHTNWVSGVAFGPDGRRILTGSFDNTAKVWDAEKGTELLALKGHTQPLNCVAFGPDGRRILTGSRDATAKVWDAEKGTEVLALKRHSGEVTGVAFRPDGKRLVTVSHDNTARVWDAGTGTEVLSLTDHSAGLLNVAYSPDGKRVVTGSYGKMAKVWDIETGAEAFALKGHTNWVSGVAFSPDGTRIVTGSHDGTTRVWDAGTGTEVLALKGHTNSVSGVAFSPDGRRILTGGFDTTAKVWDVGKGTEVVTLQAHPSIVTGGAFSPDGKRVLIGNNDNTARLYDVATGAELLTLKRQTGGVFAVAFSRDGKRMLTGSKDAAEVWDAAKGTELFKLKGHASGVNGWSFSPDGKRVLAGNSDGTATVWDAEKGTEVVTLKGHSGGVLGVAFSRDGNRLLTGSQDCTAKVWDAEKGTEILTLKGHKGWVTGVAFGGDGTRVLTGGGDETAKLWDAEKGTEILTLKGHTSVVTRVAFSPDGTRLLTGSRDTTAKVWDAEFGTELLALKGHTLEVTSVAFSPDGNRLFSGSQDGTAKVWDAEGGTELLTLKGHNGFVAKVAFSPDGKRILSGSMDNAAKVWDIEKGIELLALTGHTQPVRGVAFSPDGTLLLTGGEGTAKVWDAGKGTELLVLTGHAGVLIGVAFSADGRRAFAWDATGKVLAWSARDGKPVPADNPPPRPVYGPTRSPDGRLSAKPEGNHIAIVELLKPPIGATPWPLPDAAARNAYHAARASLAEKEQQWFAVAYHVGRLLLDDPFSADLKKRREEALTKHNGREPAPPPRAVK